MSEYTVSPYIPLSWLRDTWKHVRQLYLNNVKITHHDVWLWMVRQEISRITILELTKENLQLKKALEDVKKVARINECHQ